MKRKMKGERKEGIIQERKRIIWLIRTSFMKNNFDIWLQYNYHLQFTTICNLLPFHIVYVKDLVAIHDSSLSALTYTPIALPPKHVPVPVSTPVPVPLGDLKHHLLSSHLDYRSCFFSHFYASTLANIFLPHWPFPSNLKAFALTPLPGKKLPNFTYFTPLHHSVFRWNIISLMMSMTILKNY